MASVNWSANALQDLEEIDTVVGKRIVEKILWLEQNFDNIVPEKLHRELRNLYKLRVGDYRVVYSVYQDLITIETVGHRREVYR